MRRSPNAYLKAPFAWVFVLLVLALLLPLAYALALMLLLTLPVTLAVSAIAEARQESGVTQTQSLPVRLFVALIVLPLLLLALIAPMRALLIAAFSQFPVAMFYFHDAHAPLYGLLRMLFGEHALLWLDVGWGSYAAVGILLAGIYDSQRRNMLMEQIRALPTAKARSVAVGLAELFGKAVPCGHEGSTQPIIRSWLESSSGNWSAQQHIEPFYLDDGTGRILVDPRGVPIGSRGDAFSFKLHQIKLHSELNDRGLAEERLMPGDEVLVLGSVQINQDPSRPDDTLVVKPQKSSLLRLNFYDLFYLGHGNQELLLTDIRRSILRGWYGVALMITASCWLAVNAGTNLIQMQQLRLDAAPLHFRLLAAPTQLERKLEIGERNLPAIEWIDRIRKGGNLDHNVLLALERVQLITPLLSQLHQRAVNIEHPDFGLANGWLARMNQPVPGHWGREFNDSGAIDRDETAILRLMLTLEGTQLYATWRVHFNQSQPINASVRSRKIVLNLTRLQDNREFIIELPAGPGYSHGDDMPVSTVITPGRYRLLAYPKRQFEDSLHDRGTHPPYEVEIEI